VFDQIVHLLQGSAALMTFFTIFSVGLVITLFSLVFGGHDHGGEFHTEVEHGDVGHDEGAGPSMFSLRGLSLLATGFGAVAFLVMLYTDKVLLSSVAGLGFGWVFAFGGIAMMRMFMRQQGSSNISPSDYLESEAEVTTSIPAGGIGEVRTTVHGVTVTRPATSANGQRIPSGRMVRIVRNIGGTLSVEEFSS
jgi:hypothetical protein